MERRKNIWTSRRWQRRSVLRASGLAGAGVGAAWLVGCGDDDDGGATPTSGNGGSPTAAPGGTSTPGGNGEEFPHQRHHVFEEGTPTLGGTLVLATNEPDSFDVYAGAGGYAKGIAQNIYNHPWRAHLPTGTGEFVVEGDLVADYEQPDPNTFVLHLREGVSWQDKSPVDGRAFVADDMVQNLERMRTDEPTYSMRNRLRMIDTISAVDEHTVEIKLNWPYGYFVLNLADQESTIIAPELFDGGAVNNPVGTGPFMLDQWQQGSAVILTKNPNYWDTGLPYMDGIEYIIQTDFATNVSNFIAGQIDIFNLLTWESEEDIRSNNPDARLWETIAYPFVAALNTTSESVPALTDPRVRQAIKYATDYQAVIDVGFAGHADRAQPLAGIHPERLPVSELPERDVQRAIQLLSDAGYADGFSMTDSISNAVIPDQGHTQWANSLAEAGIDVTLDVTPFNQWIGNVFIGGNMDACTTGTFSYPPPDVQLAVKWDSAGAFNNSHYNNPDFDELLQQAREELDPDVATEHFQELSRTLLEDSPDIFLCEIRQLVGSQGRVKNYIFQDGWWGGAGMWLDVVWLEE